MECETLTGLRLATFNVESMFERPKIMNLPTWSEGKPFLDDYAQLNSLLNKEAYTSADKTTMLELLKKHGLDRKDESAYFILRRKAGNFLKRSKNKPVEIVASGRSDWIGWLELKK